MSTLDQEVRLVVEYFIKNGELFTALDVSNKVKMVMPFARHREVRDIVRASFATDIQTAGWARTPIQVTLEDSSVAEALLYHPVSDTWDLDSKYDMQKRAQAALHLAPLPTITTPTISVVVPVVASGTTVIPVLAASIPTSAPVTKAVVQAQVRDQWAAMFSSAPSLFPRK